MARSCPRRQKNQAIGSIGPRKNVAGITDVQARCTGGSRVASRYAQRTALRGGNPYRSRAYADSLAALAVPLEEGRLTEIPGVGEAIADIITKLHRTGTHPSLEKLRKEIPAGVLELLTVPGLRPDKLLRLYRDLGITSLVEPEAAAKDDRIKKARAARAPVIRGWRTIPSRCTTPAGFLSRKSKSSIA